jgi:hypothetical protein
MKQTLCAFLFLAACGGDDATPKYQETVSCHFVCDGTASDTTDTVCDTKEGILASVNQLVADCESQLSAQCASHSCVCMGPDNPPRCD